MVEKRELDAGGAAEASAVKKPRPDGPTKPTLSLEALEKAKRALQMQKELKEKLKKLPQVRRDILLYCVGNRSCAHGSMPNRCFRYLLNDAVEKG